ncbi:MAG: hypothetical protein P8R42_15200 [Candidatus Binatia bacterium]|nr:hypothetical protein [Candidatus Binatia bacterium]
MVLEVGVPRVAFRDALLLRGRPRPLVLTISLDGRPLATHWLTPWTRTIEVPLRASATDAVRQLSFALNRTWTSRHGDDPQQMGIQLHGVTVVEAIYYLQALAAGPGSSSFNLRLQRVAQESNLDQLAPLVP